MPFELIPGAALDDGALLAPLAKRFADARPARPFVFAWSSGCFTALERPGPATLFLYELPWGVDRDVGWRARLEFARMLAWRRISMPRARAAFWKMVTPRRDGTMGFERASPELRRALLAQRAPFVRSVLGLSRRDVRPRGDLEVHAAIGGASSAAMERALARLSAVQPLASRTTLDGLDHLAPLTHPERIARWVCTTLTGRAPA